MLSNHSTFRSTSHLNKWVKEAWSEIALDIVVRSFKKCGISNAMDGTEDDMLWEDDLTAEDEMLRMEKRKNLIHAMTCWQLKILTGFLATVTMKTSKASKEQQNYKKTMAPLGATKYCKRNDQ